MANCLQNIADLDEDLRVVQSSTLIFSEPDDKELNNLLSNKLNFLHLNIRSVNKNFNQFLVYIQSLASTIHLIILTETWHSGKDGATYDIPGYTTHYSPSILNRNDGVIVFTINTFEANVTTTQITNCNAIQVILNTSHRDYLVTCIYRSPSFSNIAPFTQSLDRYFLNIMSNSNTNTQLVLMGDLNIDLLSSESPVLEYLDVLSIHGLEPLIVCPTRVGPTSRTCLDHAFSNYKIKCTGSVLKCDVTDHDISILSICDALPKAQSPNINKFTLKTLDNKKLTTKIKNQDWSVVNACTVDSATENFTEILQNHINESTSEREVTIRARKLKPWITNDIVYKMKERNKLSIKSKNQPFNSAIKNEYKLLRNEINGMIFMAKNTYYREQIDEADPKCMWKVIKEMTTAKKNRKPIDTIMDEQGAATNDSEAISEEFNKFFANVGNKMAAKIKKPKSKFNVPINNNQFNLTPTTDEEVMKYINELKNDTSPGCDGIKSNVFKVNKEYICKPVKVIINKCFSEGVFPQVCKKAVVIPIHKKGDKKDVNNYRPISLTTIISKLIEKAFKQRLVDFIEESQYLSHFQFGFRTKKNTQDAILRVVNNIYEKLDKNKKILTIFIDLQKAFDSVSHELLLSKLKSAGIRGVAYNFMKSYLTNRTQLVKINSKLSSEAQVQYGVPQGTILGPILFILYINDMFSLPLNGEITCFADDTALSISGESWEEAFLLAESDMNKLKMWMDLNILTMNVTKTQYITFSINARGQPSNHLKIKIHNNECVTQNCDCDALGKVPSVQYLGVKIDQHLNWREQTIATSKRIRQTAYKFRELRHVLSLDSLRKVFYAIVHSVYNYAIVAWGGTYQSNLIPVNSAINLVLRVILKKPRRYSPLLLYNELNIFSFQKTYQLATLKLTNTLAPHQIALPPMIQHRYSTRRRENQFLETQQVTKSLTYHSPYYNALKLFNALPNEIKLLRNSNKFQKELKQWLKDNEIVLT